jgi:excisionase family DNA binding protein
MRSPKGLGVRETARQLDVSLKYVYDLLYAGRLPGRKIGRTWRIPSEAVASRVKGKK